MNEFKTGESISDAAVPEPSTNHIINIPSQPTLNHIESDSIKGIFFWPGDKISFLWLKILTTVEFILKVAELSEIDGNFLVSLK